jgi:hypothetical protein
VAVESQLPETRKVKAVPIVDTSVKVFGYLIQNLSRLILRLARPAGSGRLAALVVTLRDAREWRKRRCTRHII